MESSYSCRWDNYAPAITTYGSVCKAFSPQHHKGQHPEFQKITLLWDTGAVKSVISSRIINLLKLIPTGQATHYNTHSSCLVDKYRINLLLPNKVEIEELEVLGDILPDTDMLVGMDVISLCDFAITHPNHQTLFSFQIPSKTSIVF